MLCKNDGPLILIQLAGEALLHLLHPLCGAAGNLGNEFRSQGNSGCVCKSSVRIYCLKSEREREQGRGKKGKKMKKESKIML